MTTAATSRAPRIAIGAIPVVGALALAGCSFSEPDLDGVTASATHAVTAFDRIALNGSGDVEIEVGPEASVEVTGDTALLDAIRVTVTDGTLSVDGPSWTWGWDHSDVAFAITVPELDAVELSGSGDVTIDGIAGEALLAVLTGSGDVVLDGTVDELDIQLDGSGRIDAEQLVASTARVDLSGSGDVAVTAAERLSVDLSGSGDVSYAGGAQVSPDVSGSGEVHSR